MNNPCPKRDPGLDRGYIFVVVVSFILGIACTISTVLFLAGVAGDYFYYW